MQQNSLYHIAFNSDTLLKTISSALTIQFYVPMITGLRRTISDIHKPSLRPQTQKTIFVKEKEK